MDSSMIDQFSVPGFEEFPTCVDLEDIEPIESTDGEINFEIISEENNLKFLDQEQSMENSLPPIVSNGENLEHNIEVNLKKSCTKTNFLTLPNKRCKPRTTFDKKFRNCVEYWLRRHSYFPYPDEELKNTWAEKFGVSKRQINNLLVNLRRRNKDVFVIYPPKSMFKAKACAPLFFFPEINC